MQGQRASAACASGRDVVDNAPMRYLLPVLLVAFGVAAWAALLDGSNWASNNVKPLLTVFGPVALGTGLLLGVMAWRASRNIEN